MSVVFTLKYILGLSNFVFSGNKERKNGAMNVGDVAIFSLFENFSHTIQIWEYYWLHPQYYLLLDIF